MSVTIYQTGRVVGVVTGSSTIYRLVTEDAALRRAVADVLRRPAARLSGTYADGVSTDAVEVLQPGDPGHFESALTDGGLIQYGYVGRVEDDAWAT